MLTPEVAQAAPGPEHRDIRFPVQDASRYGDDFGAPRSGGRFHEGNDILGAKLQRVLAPADGMVTYVRVDGGGLSGNMVTITDPEGWSYRSMHLNNDTPGTDDGLNPPQWILAPGIAVGTAVRAGQHVAYLGDSGNAEGTSPHVHFEIRRPDGSPLNPFVSLRLAQGLPVGAPLAMAPPPPPPPPPPAARRPARRARRPQVRRRAPIRRASRPAARPPARPRRR